MNGDNMGLTNLNFDSKNSAHNNTHYELSRLIKPIIGSLGIVGGAIVDLPEELTAIVVIVVVLSIVYAIGYGFNKAGSLVGDIWVIGHTLRSKLLSISRWITGFFRWIDELAISEITNLGHGIYNTGNYLYHVFARDVEDFVSRLQRDIWVLNYQQSAEVNRAIAAEQTTAANLQAQVRLLEGQLGSARAQASSDIRSLQAVVNLVNGQLRAQIITLGTGLTNEIGARINDSKSLHGDITAIEQTLRAITQHIGILTPEITALEKEQIAGQAVSQTSIAAIATLEAEVATQKGEIISLESRPQVIQVTQVIDESNIAAALASLTVAQVVTLAELANDPCMCLAPLGGIEVLGALIAALEVGIL